MSQIYKSPMSSLITCSLVISTLMCLLPLLRTFNCLGFLTLNGFLCLLLATLSTFLGPKCVILMFFLSPTSSPFLSCLNVVLTGKSFPWHSSPKPLAPSHHDRCIILKPTLDSAIWKPGFFLQLSSSDWMLS